MKIILSHRKRSWVVIVTFGTRVSLWIVKSEECQNDFVHYWKSEPSIEHTRWVDAGLLERSLDNWGQPEWIVAHLLSAWVLHNLHNLRRFVSKCHQEANDGYKIDILWELGWGPKGAGHMSIRFHCVFPPIWTPQTTATIWSRDASYPKSQTFVDTVAWRQNIPYLLQQFSHVFCFPSINWSLHLVSFHLHGSGDLRSGWDAEPVSVISRWERCDDFPWFS